MNSPLTLPAFHRIEQFPALQQLARHWQVMANEACYLTRHVMPIDRVDKNHDEVYRAIQQSIKNGEPYGWVMGFGGLFGPNPNWLQYGLILNDQPLPEAMDTMPETLRLLQSCRGIRVAALARMKPNTLLSTHTHAELASRQLLQMHLTLSAAGEHNFAYLNVNGEFHQHRQGQAVIFNGGLPHFALNASAAERLVLYLEFHQPTLQQDL